MIENLNYLYQKQSVAETPNFAGKHKRALSKQSKSSNSKNKATKSLNRDLNLGIPEKENARTRPQSKPKAPSFDNGGKPDLFKIQNQNAEDISFQFPDKDVITQIENYRYLGDLQDINAIDTEVNLDFVEKLIIETLQVQNPEFLGEISSDECKNIRLPDNLELMSLYHQELTKRLMTDPTQNIYRLLIKSNEKLVYVARTIEQQSHGNMNLKFSLPQLLDQAIKLALIDIKIEQKALHTNITSSNQGKMKHSQGALQSNIKIVDYQTDELIKSLNDIQQNIQKISIRSKSRGKSAKKGKLAHFAQNQEIKDSQIPKIKIEPTFPQNKEEPVRNRFLSDSDYKLILKSLRAWKIFTSQNRGQKIERDAMAKLMIKSIDFHEKSLSQKVFRSFLIFKIKRARLNYCEDIISSVQKQNVEKFYFKMMRKRFARSRKFKYLKVIAKNFRKEKIFRGAFVGWRKALNQEKIDQISLHQKFTDSGCRATEILLEIIAYNYFHKSKEQFRDHLQHEKIFDIVRLHSFASKNFTTPDPSLAKPVGTKSKLSGTKSKKRIVGPTRLRSQNLALFNQAVEHVLIQKQKRVFKFWRRRVDSLKYLRFKIVMNYKARAFKGFLSIYNQGRQIKRFQTERARNLTSVVFYTILNTKIRKHLNRELGQQIQDSNQKKIRSQYLKEWLKVFNYYSQFTQTQASLSHKKQSQAHFSAKFWRRLKVYTNMRRAHRANMIRADQHYFDTKIKQCFQIWGWLLLVHKKKAKRVGRIIAKDQKWAQKVAYFRAFQRAFLLSKETKKLREKTLKKKVFKSHQKRKEFKSLKLVILNICIEKYQTGLKTKSLNTLSKATKESLRLNGLLKVHQLKKSKRLMQNVMIAFLSSMGERALKRKEYIQIDQVRDLKVLSKCFKLLILFTQDSKRLKSICIKVKAESERRMRKHFMYTMLLRYNKVSLMKQLAVEVQANKLFRIQKYAFSKWLFRYRYLTQVCKSCIQRRQNIARSEIFQIWKIKCDLTLKFKAGYKKLQSKSELAFLAKIMKELSAYSKMKIHFKKMSQICTFKFLRSHLGKCLNILKYNRYYSIQKRNANRRWLLRQKGAIFNICKRKWFRNKSLREHLAVRNLKIKRSIFQDFKEAWSYQKNIKATFLKVWMSREKDLLEMCFDTLKNLKEIRETVKVLGWDQADKFRARFVLTRWRKLNRSRKYNYKHLIQFTEKSRVFTIQRHLKAWRELSFFEFIEKRKAVPHFEDIVTMVNLRKRIIQVLRKNVEYQREKKIKMSRAFEYYRFSLLSKVLETFSWYRDIQIERQNKVEFLTENRKQKWLQAFVGKLKERVRRNNKYKEIAEFVSSQHDEIVVQGFFQKWKKKFAKKKASEPTKNYASSYYVTKQKQQVFRILYNHRTFQIIKKNMKITAFNYRSREIQKRVFDRLLFHVHVQIEKRERNQKAQIHYKRVLMARWIISLNNSYILNEQILASVNGDPEDKFFSNNFTSGSLQLHQFESVGSLKQLISRTQSKPKMQAQFKSQNHLNAQQLSQIISNQELGKNNSITDIISQSQNIEKDSQLGFDNSSVQGPLNLEELNSTQDLIKAHDILSKKVQSLDFLGPIHNSNELDQNQNGDFPQHSQTQKNKLVSMMSQIKLKYQERKCQDFDKKLSKSIHLSDEDIKMTEKDQQAQIVHNKSLAKRVLKNMHEITAGKLIKYQNGIKAQTFTNVQLKKKSFNCLALYAFRKKSLRQNEIQMAATIVQRLKFKVLSQLYMYKEGQKRKVNNQKAANRFVKQMRIKRSFASIKMNLIRNVLGQQVAQMREQKTIENYFVKWLALANQSLKERHQILSNRENEYVDDLDEFQDKIDEGQLLQQNLDIESPLMVDEQQLFTVQQDSDLDHYQPKVLGITRKNQMEFQSTEGVIQRKDQTDFDTMKMLKPSAAGIVRKDQMDFIHPGPKVSSLKRKDQMEFPHPGPKISSLKRKDQTNFQPLIKPEKSNLQRKNQTHFNNSKVGSKLSTIQQHPQQHSDRNQIGSQEFEVEPEMESNHKQTISKGEFDGDVNNQPDYDPADPEEEFKSMISSKNEEFKSMSSNSN